MLYVFNVFSSEDRDPSTRWFESPREIRSEDDRGADRVVQDIIRKQIAPGQRVFYSVWHYPHPAGFLVTAGAVEI